jgi:hypothetical protein
MNRIDKYLNSIYNNINESSIEIQELKQEMRSHLIETINELKSEGLSEDESINIAIDRFGDEYQISEQLIYVLNFQRVISKNILKAALVFSVICIIAISTSYFMHKGFNIRLNTMYNQVHTLQSKLVNEGIDNADKYLSEIFEGEDNQLRYVKMTELPMNYDKSKLDDVIRGNVRYSFPKEIKSNYDSNVFIEDIVVNNTNYLLEISVKKSSQTVATDIPDGISIVAISICLVLWVIWILLNLSKNKGLNNKSFN